MKKKLPISIIVFSFIILASLKLKAQDNLDCEFNIREAVFYLKGDDNFKKDSLKSISLLKPCVNIGNPKALFVLGKLHSLKNTKKDNKIAFRLFEKSAKQNYAPAITALGILHKYGRGCRLNLNKARKYFKKGALLQDNKAMYCLGYLYLKGYGEIDQNYSKAIKWFKKSNHPMAKYWLGACYYYGYGVTQNIEKANSLLGTDFDLKNKKTSIKTKIIKSIQASVDSSNASSLEEKVIKPITENDLFGKWKGSLLQFDWSGKYIEQQIPVSIKFEVDTINNISKQHILINNQEFETELDLFNNTIFFEDFEYSLPHQNFNTTLPSTLDYELLSSELNIAEYDNTKYLVGSVENYIPKWKETGKPLTFIIKKEETFSNSNQEISEDILLALSEQKHNFIKLYPNPFEDDLIISYYLERKSTTKVEVTDINGFSKTTLQQIGTQNKGKYTYYYDGKRLRKGIYIVSVYVNSNRTTKLIIKN